MKKKVYLFIKRYGWIGVLNHFYYYLYTKLFYNKSRLIRLPIEIRGKHLINFGNNLTTGSYCRIEAVTNSENLDHQSKQIEFGNDIIINDNVHIAARYSVKIGNNVLIASNVFITDHQHGDYKTKYSSPLISPNNRPLSGAPIIIEDDVWIGETVSVLPGVTIGKGCVIGTQSVVNKSIPSYSIAVGAPAVVIKRYNFEKAIWEKA